MEPLHESVNPRNRIGADAFITYALIAYVLIIYSNPSG